MIALSRFLLIVDRNERAHASLNKALLLARYFGASVRIFLCETGSYGHASGAEPALRGTPAAARATEAQEYVEALARTISSSDVPVSSTAVCFPSLSQAVEAENRSYHADLIVAAAPVRASLRLKGGVPAWQQVLDAGIPVLVTHGRPWNPTPQFAGIVESTDENDLRVTSTIAALSTSLSNRCQAELHVLLSSTARDPVEENPDWRRWWGALAGKELTGTASCRTLVGELGASLARVLRQRDYDLVVMGRPRSARGPKPSIAATVIASTSSDVMLA